MICGVPTRARELSIFDQSCFLVELLNPTVLHIGVSSHTCLGKIRSRNRRCDDGQPFFLFFLVKDSAGPKAGVWTDRCWGRVKAIKGPVLSRLRLPMQQLCLGQRWRGPRSQSVTIIRIAEVCRLEQLHSTSGWCYSLSVPNANKAPSAFSGINRVTAIRTLHA